MLSLPHGSSIHHQDPRKRRDTLVVYSSFESNLDFSLYPEICEALRDDNERCRLLAIPLVVAMSKKYNDCLVFMSGCDEQVRLEDDAFCKLCLMLTDSSVEVKTLAASSLGQFSTVSETYLMMTLDKKCNAQFCGAFIYGLEDESMNVRMASLESMCKLSIAHAKFAEKSIESTVDMFNDEIEDIRLKAIYCLKEINHISFRDDQIDIILTVLDSPTMDIREALYDMIAGSMIATPISLKKCIECILSSLSKYPHDRLSIFKCFRYLGQSHARFVKLLVDELLAVHPYLKLPEQSLMDQNYIAILILVFNACQKLPEIFNLLEEHTQQHYTYICATQPDFIPAQESKLACHSTASVGFFMSIFNRLKRFLATNNRQQLNSSSNNKQASCISSEARNSLFEASVSDLSKFGCVEREFKASTEFYCCFIQCILSISKILDSSDWTNSYSSFGSNSCLFTSTIQRVLDQTLELQHKYHKLSALQHCCILQLRLKTLAIKLVAFISSSNASALDLCDEFLEEHRNLQEFLAEFEYLDSVGISQLCGSIFDEIDSLEQPKPGTVSRKIEPLLTQRPFVLDQVSELLLLLIGAQQIDSLRQMKASSARFLNEEQLEKGAVYKFTAGLVLSLTIDTIIENVRSTSDVAIKVVYPDKRAQVIVPIACHFRLMSRDELSGTETHRLYTCINLSHEQWSEPSNVELSLILDFRDNKSSCIDLSSSSEEGAETSQIIELGKSICIQIHPQARRP